MEEYRLTEATLEDGAFRVAFRRKAQTAVATVHDAAVEEPVEESPPVEPTLPAEPVGIPIGTPMSGIFYDAPSPTSPPFVKEGDFVTAGQIVGLIEAMKVFNEIPAMVGGTVKRIVAEPGSVVAVGDTLILLA